MTDANINTNNATAWNPNANGSVFALAVSGSTVYAGGGFSTIGGRSRNRVAALDATTGNATAWDPNASSTVSALAVSGSTIYIGGAFSQIASDPQGGFAAFGADPPANTAPPELSTVGGVVSCSAGTWSGNPTMFERQWLRDGIAIGGETGTTYTLGEADLGHAVSCRVTATNDTASVSARSDSVFVTQGPAGPTGSTGGQGPAGPAGIGEAGPTGPQGPAGRDATVTCKPKRRKGIVRVRCKVVFANASTVTQAKLVRRGKVYARGRPTLSNELSVLRFAASHRLSTGVYFLVVRERLDDGSIRVTRTPIRIG